MNIIFEGNVIKMDNIFHNFGDYRFRARIRKDTDRFTLKDTTDLEVGDIFLSNYSGKVWAVIDKDKTDTEEGWDFVDMAPDETLTTWKAEDLLDFAKLHKINTDDITDGYHTFGELYHQRAVLFATILKLKKDDPVFHGWKSKKHSDGKYCFDSNGKWFITGINTPEGMYTYHYETEKYWDMFDCEELETSPEWDGHTDKDVTRLLSLFTTPPKIITIPEKEDIGDISHSSGTDYNKHVNLYPSSLTVAPTYQDYYENLS